MMNMLYTFRPVGDGVEDVVDMAQSNRLLRPRIGFVSHDMRETREAYELIGACPHEMVVHLLPFSCRPFSCSHGRQGGSWVSSSGGPATAGRSPLRCPARTGRLTERSR
jgi:hypothetical protein